MNALMYEYFLRDAFGNNTEKYGDPAGLADAGVFNHSYDKAYLNKLKIGAGYAIVINNRKYENKKELRDPYDYDKMDQFINEVLVAKTGNEVVETIQRYIEFRKELEQLKDRY